MGIFASLYGKRASLLQGIWDTWNPLLQVSIKIHLLGPSFIMFICAL